MLNTVSLMGRFVKDPELRHTQSGTAVASFTLAVSRDKERDIAEFIDCVAWKGTAEFITKHFTKGQQAVALGRLQARTWQDKDGNNRKAIEVVVNNIYFAGSNSNGNSSNAGAGANYEQNEFAELTEDDGDLPF